MRILVAFLLLELTSAAQATTGIQPVPPKTDKQKVAEATAAVQAATSAKGSADAKAAAAVVAAKEADDAAVGLEAIAAAADKAAQDAKAGRVTALAQADVDAKAAAADTAAKVARDSAKTLALSAAGAKDEATAAATSLARANNALAAALIIAPDECHGWGLLTPLYGVSNRGPSRIDPNKRDELRLTGPVASGIGGGYYRPLNGACSNDRMWTAEFFGFSEGLDPSKTFQLGIGAGIGLTVFGKFQFGVAVGYDLVRHENIESGGVARTYDNGLLLDNDVFGCGHGGAGDHWGDAAKCATRNATLLFTFTLTTGSTDSSAPKPPAN
jgi:hypothetical protein